MEESKVICSHCGEEFIVFSSEDDRENGYVFCVCPYCEKEDGCDIL